MYDIYTPMIADAAKRFPMMRRRRRCLRRSHLLVRDYVATVKEGFENRWIDVYENEGKRSGAYSAGAFGTHPYVLLNYNDTLDNMFTLAHEMGLRHAFLVPRMQISLIFTPSTRFSVAEVASTRNEILLMEYLLANTTDKKSVPTC